MNQANHTMYVHLDGKLLGNHISLSRANLAPSIVSDYIARDDVLAIRRTNH
jgi:hypothetical protein